MTIPVAVVSATGISAPTYEEIRLALVNSFKSIYGDDIYVEPDSQDGQLLSVFAQAIFDVNQMAVAVYNDFSPSTAQGAGLSSVVKINGIRRMVATNSTVAIRIVGQAGTIITNGIVGDNLGLGTRWALPETVTVPVEGEITVTATCTEAGAVTAAVATLTEILTPTRGWQEASNTSAATAGAPVETDAALRRRQTISTALPGLSVMDSIVAAVSSLDGVQRLRGYENDEDAPDDLGLPGHSISLVVEGGDLTEICETINLTKTPGTGTYGTTSAIVFDSRGVPNTINFFILSEIPASVRVYLTPRPGYVSSTGDLIKAAVAQYINNLDIGIGVLVSKILQPANLSGEAAIVATGLTQQQLDRLSDTFEITGVWMSRDGLGVSPTDLEIGFNEAAICDVTNVEIDLP